MKKFSVLNYLCLLALTCVVMTAKGQTAKMNIPVVIDHELATLDEVLLHTKPVFVLNEWMRDPYIYLAPDDYY